MKSIISFNFLGIFLISIFNAFSQTTECASLTYWNSITPSPQTAISPTAICTSSNLTKHVNVNVHFVLKNDGTGNFTDVCDGYGNTQQQVRFLMGVVFLWVMAIAILHLTILTLMLMLARLFLEEVPHMLGQLILVHPPHIVRKQAQMLLDLQDHYLHLLLIV